MDLINGDYCPRCHQSAGGAAPQHQRFCPGHLQYRRIDGYGPMTFMEWKQAVDRAVMRLAYVGCDDLADAPYWDSWDVGTSPQAMARQVLSDNDFPLDEV